MFRTTALRLAFAALLASTASVANAVNLVNGSFEDTTGFVPPSNDTMSLAGGSTVMNGWTVTGDSLAWIGPTNPFLLAASNGSYFLDLTDYTAGAPFGGVSQVLNTLAGHSYLVSFDLGSSNHWGGQSGLQVSAAGTSASFLSTTTPDVNTWESKSFTFNATGATTTLSFLGNLGVNYIGLDNISISDLGLVGAVPEPATWLMMLLGIGALGAALRRPKTAPTGAWAAQA